MSFVWLKFYWILLIALIVAGTNDTEPDKNIEEEKGEDYSFLVVGGYRPRKHTLAKHIVSLRKGPKSTSSINRHYCAGSIIRSKVILTAAHCVVDKNEKTYDNDITVVAGSPNLATPPESARTYSVKRALAHPVYSRKTMRSDLALLVLDEEIELDGDTRSIVPLIDTKPTPGMKCISLGWGRIFPDGPLPIELVYVNLTLIRRSECSAFFRMNPSVICAADPRDPEKGVWKGDSGGPLICDGKLTGVVSFGYPREDSPNFFSNVYEHRKWILENSGKRLILSVFNFLIVLFVDLISLVVYQSK